MEEDGGHDPGRLGKSPERGQQSGKAEGGDQAELQARRQDAVVAQQLDDAKVIVLVGIPKIPKLDAHESHPCGKVGGNVGVGLGGPEFRDLGTGQFPAGSRLGEGDGVFQEAFLGGADARGHLGIAGGCGVVADPEIDAAVGGEHDRLVGDEVVVNPGGRSADIQPRDKGRDGGGDLRSACRPGLVARHAAKHGDDQQRDGKKDGGHQHGDEAAEEAETEPRLPPRSGAGLDRKPQTEIVGEDEPHGRHEHPRKRPARGRKKSRPRPRRRR